AAAPEVPRYQRHVIDHHNVHRRNHSVADIHWDQGLADTALKTAKTCVYAHDVEMDGGGYGQNIAAGAEETNITAILTEIFYNHEMMNFEKWYGWETPGDINDHDAFIGWGHFTQIVWADTTHVGCATYDCRFSGKGIAGLENVSKECSPYFTVCNYKTSGNFPGQFNKMVNRPQGHPVVHWD
ncbi:PR-1-like protein, partial [Eremomyces bilateralis CBS 781.70]